MSKKQRAQQCGVALGRCYARLARANNHALILTKEALVQLATLLCVAEQCRWACREGAEPTGYERRWLFLGICDGLTSLLEARALSCGGPQGTGGEGGPPRPGPLGGHGHVRYRAKTQHYELALLVTSPRAPAEPLVRLRFPTRQVEAMLTLAQLAGLAAGLQRLLDYCDQEHICHADPP